jgi:uncharacterized damage-inducible protein DinB
MTAGIQFAELLDYNAEETGQWKDFFSRNTPALDLPLDIADAGSVRRLVQHILVVELFFANAVSGLPQPDFEKLPVAQLGDLFRIGEDAAAKYRQFFSRATNNDWEATVDMGARLGIHPTKRKMVAQALTHSIRHWAQLSTFLRQQGLKQDWVHDFLMSKAMK